MNVFVYDILIYYVEKESIFWKLIWDGLLKFIDCNKKLPFTEYMEKEVLPMLVYLHVIFNLK